MRPPKQAGAGGCHLVIIRTADGTPGDEDNVPPRRNLSHLQANDLTQLPLDPVSLDGEAKPADFQPIGQRTENKQIDGHRAPFGADLLEVPIIANSVTSLHRKSILWNWGAPVLSMPG
jgi:hypothetical protein